LSAFPAYGETAPFIGQAVALSFASHPQDPERIRRANARHLDDSRQDASHFRLPRRQGVAGIPSDFL